jgi:hypothetical protein
VQDDDLVGAHAGVVVTAGGCPGSYGTVFKAPAARQGVAGMVTGKAVADVVWYGAEASVRRGLAGLPPPEPARIGAHACPAVAS